MPQFFIVFWYCHYCCLCLKFLFTPAGIFCRLQVANVTKISKPLALTKLRNLDTHQDMQCFVSLYMHDAWREGGTAHCCEMANSIMSRSGYLVYVLENASGFSILITFWTCINLQIIPAILTWGFLACLYQTPYWRVNFGL